MKTKVHAVMAVAIIAIASTVTADTVVHYTFDDLGDVGTTLADSSTVVNKANPGTLDAKVYGMYGKEKRTTSTALPLVAAGIPDSLRVLDPAGGTIASAADKALRFPGGNAAGNGAMLETPNDSALRPSSFTVEMFVRLTEGRSGWQMLACQPSTTADRYGWAISFYQSTYVAMKLMFIKADGTQQDCQFDNGATTLLDWKWHHIAMTVYPHATDSSKTVVRLYLDYAKIYDYNAPFVLSLSDSADCPVQIGGTTVAGQNFTGEIGEFRFSSGVLDPGEFLRPHNAAIDKDVVLYYDFEGSNAYEGNFGTTETTLLNKASPILPGNLQTRTFDVKGTLPKVDDETAPTLRLRHSMSDLDWSDNAASLFNGYEGGQRYNNYLYCDLPSSMSLADTNFTVEMFCKTDGSVNWWTSVFRDKNDQVWIGGGEDGNKFMGRVTLDDGTTQKTVIDTTSANDGKWHHIALVREGTALTLYRDKKVAASTTLTSSSLKAIGNQWHFIGGPNGGNNDFNGWLDSVRVTRRALGPEEFLTSQHYPESSTIAHLKFDDGTANAADGGCALFDGPNNLTFSDDVPGYKITDGEGGSVLSKPDVKSLSVPSAAFTYSNWDDLYYLRKDANGKERTSGTVELWVKGSVKKTYAAILDAKISANGNYNDNLHAWRLGYDANDGGKPSVLFRYLKTDGSRDNQRLTFDPGVTDGKWHHWAFTFQPNASDPTKSDIAFYLDHDQLGAVQTLPGRVAYDDTLRFAIGEGGSSFTGLIDELRISDCVLTPAQFLRAEKEPGLTIIFR